MNEDEATAELLKNAASGRSSLVYDVDQIHGYISVVKAELSLSPPPLGTMGACPECSLAPIFIPEGDYLCPSCRKALDD